MLKPIQYKFLEFTSKTNCSSTSQKTFHDCIYSKIMEDNQYYKECEKICLPILMQTVARLGSNNNSWPICEKSEENACMMKIMFNKLISSSKAQRTILNQKLQK